ncbi:MAG: hypothetical protein WC055_12745 [Melioribacteraceae bacterium]
MPTSFDTPILIIIFNRPDTTSKVFEVIRKIKPNKLFVAADGARHSIKNEINKCKQAREIFNQVDWPCELQLLFRIENLGCRMAVSSSIDWFFKQVDYGIILEDDILPDLTFFQFCQEMLLKYKDDYRIYHINGANFQDGQKRGDGSYYFSNFPIIWGWATWRDRWACYDIDMKDFPHNLKKLQKIKIIDKKSAQLRFLKHFELMYKKKHNTWDTQWVYRIWSKSGISITPNCNLVRNIGTENNSTHNFLRDSKRDDMQLKTIDFPLVIPSYLSVSMKADVYLYNNIYGYNILRLLRILRENKVTYILKHIYGKLKVN